MYKLEKFNAVVFQLPESKHMFCNNNLQSEFETLYLGIFHKT